MPSSRPAREQNLEEPMPATLGGYAVVAPLARGVMADVFLAVPRDGAQAPRPHVVKLLRRELAGDAVARATFVDEASLAARFSHANLVSTFEVGATADDCPFLVMDFRDGQNLARLADAARAASVRMPHQLFARVVTDALAGLHYAHELADYDGTPLGVLHRDVSPDNVVVGYDGHTTLIDFGVARAAAHLSHSDSGIIKGKIGYMAPETIDDGMVDRRSDVFSMGVVLWELVAGQRLATYGGGAPHFFSSRPLPRLQTVAPGVHSGLDGIVAVALERDPTKRFPTARAMREALERYLWSRAPFAEEEVGAWVSFLFAPARAKLRAALEKRASEVSAGRRESVTPKGDVPTR